MRIQDWLFGTIGPPKWENAPTRPDIEKESAAAAANYLSRKIGNNIYNAAKGGTSIPEFLLYLSNAETVNAVIGFEVQSS